MRQERQGRPLSAPHAGAEDDLPSPGAAPSQRQAPSPRTPLLTPAARRGGPPRRQECGGGVLRFPAVVPALASRLVLPPGRRFPRGRRANVPLALGVVGVGGVHGAAARGEGERAFVCGRRKAKEDERNQENVY